MSVARKLGIALLTFALLVELQILSHKLNRYPDVLGGYLRQVVESKQAMRLLPAAPANSVRENSPLTQ